MIRGYLVNEFDERIGTYNINGNNEYSVSLYHENKGFMTEKQLVDFANNMSLYFEESKVVLNKRS